MLKVFVEKKINNVEQSQFEIMTFDSWNELKGFIKGYSLPDGIKKSNFPDDKNKAMFKINRIDGEKFFLIHCIESDKGIEFTDGYITEGDRYISKSTLLFIFSIRENNDRDFKVFAE